MRTLREIADIFNAKRYGKEFKAVCPCHNDSKASLAISEKDGKILFHCFAGCNTADILKAKGLEWADIMPELEKPVKLSFVPQWGGDYEPVKVYNYGAYYKARFERQGRNGEREKTFVFGTYESGVFKAKAGIKNEQTAALYKSENIAKAKANNNYLYIFEGEKDVDFLEKLGYKAVTAGGAKDWRKKFIPLFKGLYIVILPDNDLAGEEAAAQILNDLHNVAFAVKVVYLSKLEKGDISDYFQIEGGTKYSFKATVEAENWIYADWVIIKENGNFSGINADLLAATVEKNLNYRLVTRQGVENEEFFTFQNGVYLPSSKAAIKGKIKEFIPTGKARDNTLNEIFNLMLCSDKGRCAYEDFNADEDIINFQNGILNISSNQLSPHNADVLSTFQLTCNYDTAAHCPNWLHFIGQICEGQDGTTDKSKVYLLQEVAGLLLSDIFKHRFKKIFILYSTIGDTGKSTFINVLCDLIGLESVGSLPLDKMTERFQLGCVYGAKLLTSSELKTADMSDSSIFKSLTGGDPVQIELKGKKPFPYTFRGGMLYACNNLPFFTDDKGEHLFKRLMIIPFYRSFSESEQDKGLEKRLKAEKSGIALWAIEGLKRFIDNGYMFTKCEAVDSIAREYRQNSDTVFHFISECCELTGNKKDRISRTELHNSYEDWARKNGLHTVSNRNIVGRFEKCGICSIKSNGGHYYCGIKFKLYDSIETADCQTENIFRAAL